MSIQPTAAQRVLAIPELLELILSHFPPSALPSLAPSSCLSHLWRATILRLLQRNECVLYRLAISAASYRHLPQLALTVRAVAQLPPQSPRPQPWCRRSRPYTLHNGRTTELASGMYGAQTDAGTWSDIDAEISTCADPSVALRWDVYLADRECYIEQHAGRHWLPTRDGHRAVNLPVKALVATLLELLHRQPLRFPLGAVLLYAEYHALVPAVDALWTKPLLAAQLRADAAANLARLCAVYPGLATQRFEHAADTVLAAACAHKMRPSACVELLVARGADLHIVPWAAAEPTPLERCLQLRFPRSTVRVLVAHGAQVRWQVLKRLAGPSGDGLAGGVLDDLRAALQRDAAAVLADPDRSPFARQARQLLKKQRRRSSGAAAHATSVVGRMGAWLKEAPWRRSTASTEE